MKRIITLALAAVMLLSAAFAFSACSDKKVECVATDAADLLKEDFGIAVKKGNTELLGKVNEVINEWVTNGTMTKYVEYYDAMAKGENADAGDLKTSWDFGSASEIITVYTESGFAPFEFVKDNNVIGVDIAIMSEVAQRAGKKLEIKDVDFNTITTSVKTSSGDAVGAAGITITDERSEEVDFSSIYYSSTLVIVTAKDKVISKVADLSKLKVGVQEGTSGDLIISAARGEGHTFEDEDEKTQTIKVDSSTDVRRYKQYGLALADLKAGRIDAILMDKLPAQTMLAASDN